MKNARNKRKMWVMLIKTKTNDTNVKLIEKNTVEMWKRREKTLRNVKIARIFNSYVTYHVMSVSDGTWNYSIPFPLNGDRVKCHNFHLPIKPDLTSSAALIMSTQRDQITHRAATKWNRIAHISLRLSMLVISSLRHWKMVTRHVVYKLTLAPAHLLHRSAWFWCAK